MMLFIRSMFACFLCLLFANIALAATQKLGFVDYDVAVKEEKEAQKYFKDLEAQEIAVAAWEQEANTKLEKKLKTYEEKKSKLKPDKLKAEETKLRAEVQELQQESVKRRQDVTTNQKAKLAELKSKNSELVKVLANKEGYSMIFNAAILDFVSEDMKKNNDITPKLIKLYNEKYPVKATPAAAEPKPGAAEPKPATKTEKP